MTFSCLDRLASAESLVDSHSAGLLPPPLGGEPVDRRPCAPPAVYPGRFLFATRSSWIIGNRRATFDRESLDMLYRVTLFPPDREWQCTWHGTRTLAVKAAQVTASPPTRRKTRTPVRRRT